MDNLLQSVIEEKMKDGTVERIMAEQFEKAITAAVESMFSYSGEGRKIVQDKVKDVMIPAIETYDFNKFLPKLDLLLTQIAKDYRLPEYQKLANNFCELMKKPFEQNQMITLTELSIAYRKYIAKEIDTSNLEVCYDDGVSYEDVEYRVNFEEDERPSWSSFNRAHIAFDCEQDENNEHAFILELTQWKDCNGVYWKPNVVDIYKDAATIANIDEFNLFLANLNYFNCKIEIDNDFVCDCVTPDAEPEASYS